MKLEISKHNDALLHTAKRVAIATSATVVLTLTLLGIAFGIDLEATVRLGRVVGYGVATGVIIAALLTAVLTYRSSLLMQELNLARIELLRISRTDQLTGLLNRRGYDEIAFKALERAGKANIPAVALMCDIDRFKAINDEFGHEFGDKVLMEIGEAIRSFGKANRMLVARHGGEEFAAIMIGVTTEQAIHQANALRRICAATEISRSGGASASVTVSIGLAISNDPTTLPIMMRVADRALYLAKHAGRDQVVPADVAAEVIAA
jgi:diguanylate cyclase (GGDEF)-like protein